MDSWTLQGDSYSFLRSAPRTFSLCHRDGTPNHVEIFDIINTPSQRSAISETTCLCDIFGDDCEASLSSSPASAAFIPQQTEVEGRAVTSPSVDDNNDSSGSYHTAHSSIEGEEGLEDTNEKQNCVPLQSLTEEQTPPEFSGTTNRAHCRASPDLTTVCDGILPENKTPQTHSPEGSCHSLSSSLVDITYTPSPSSSRKGISETESRRTTPASKDRHSSLSQHTPTPELENCVSSSASVTTQPEVWELSSEPGHICNHNFTKLPPDNVITPLNFQPKVIVSSTDILLSPRPALRGRISVHDLFSRGSTPDLDDHPQTHEPIPSPINVKEDITVSVEPDTNDTESTPDLQYTSPSPVNSPTPSPEPGSISSEIIRLNSPSPSPSRLSPTSPHSPATRSPTAALSPQQKYIYTPPPSRSSLYSPVLTHLSPSPVYSPIVCIDKASSPEIRITASSPELENELKSPVFEPQLDSPVVQSPVPPHITNVSPVVQSPTPSRITNISPVDQSPTPSHITNVSPVIQSPTPHHITNISPVVQSLTPSPITNISPVAQSPTPSPITNISPVAQSPTPSPITNISPVAQSPTPRHITNISPVVQSPTPSPTTNISPVAQSPTPRHITNISPVVQSPTPRHITNISPVVQSPTPRHITNISPVVQSLTPSPITNISPVVQSLTPSPITNISPVVQSLTPSPITNISPVVQSLTPSPITNISPVVQSLTPSPITNISPVVQSLTPSPITNISPVVQSPTPCHITNITNIVQPPASPHITNISYSIVQPEDQPSPAFSEEPCLSESPIPRDFSPSRYSSHSSLVFDLQSQQQSEDTHKTPSPKIRNHSPLSSHCQSLSPHYKCDISQAAEPLLSETLSEDKFDCCTFKDTVEQQNLHSSIDVAETEESAQPASPYKLHSEDSNSVCVLPVSPSYSPPPVCLSESAARVTTSEVQSAVELGSNLYAEKQDTDRCYIEGKGCFKKSPTVVNYPITDPVLPVPKENTTLPVKKRENPQPQFINYSQSNRTFNTNLTPKPFRRQLSGTVGAENKSTLRENMASHVKKRRTPSPPLTRFTPVHIIAPEKPYRQWQTRGRSPPQVKTSLPSANLKKVVTNTEIPHHDLVNNSQEDWFRKRRPQEMERGLRLQESAIDQEQQDCGKYREGKREEQIPEKGEGWHGDASYREEQVELSFNAKNRKGPVSRNTAPTGRDSRPGLPTVHSSSESQLTRQPKQQQTTHRLSSQPDTRSGRLGRRLQPPITQHRSASSGRVATNKPGRSSSSSMGSELDEADHEVKWFSDVAFSSLSSPEVDYLDMYNSSHRSSTNASQPSTQDSPAGVSTPWLSYADFRGSAQMLDNDEFALQQSSTYYSDGLDPSRCYELGSFECVDVAVEKEDSRRVRRGVPKRQIQLKRRDTTESKDESSENSSPGIPLMDNLSQDTHQRETLLRQHSTPASSLDPEPYEENPALDKHQNVTKSKLQKSPSFDESCSKTKIATCLIKSVLTKKMQSDELTGEEEPCDVDESISTTKTSKSPKPDMQLLSSSLQSDSSILSDTFGGRSDTNVKDEVGRQKNLRGKLSHRPSSTNSNRSVTFSIADSEEAEAETRSAILQSEPKATSSKEVSDNNQRWKETEHDDSTNSTAGNSGPATEAGASSTGHAAMTNREQECENTQAHKQAQEGVHASYKPKSPNSLSILLSEKKKASLNVCLTPETENKSFISDEKVESCVNDKIEDQMDEKMKGPIHKVRDVRRLVKNTYNLSFKATSAAPSDDTNSTKEQTEKENTGEVAQLEGQESQDVKHKETSELNEESKESNSIKTKDEKNCQHKQPTPQSQPMQIEYKAVCWKEDKSKTATDTQPITETQLHHVNEAKHEDATSFDVQSKGKVSAVAEKQHILTHQHVDRPMLGSLPKMPSKEREVSTAIVLIRDNSRTKRSASPSHEEFPSTVPASSPGLSGTPGGSGHSVSMLLKEKGYHADIGAVVGEGQNAGSSKSAPSKHVNCLEIPLQTSTESHRERTFSSSSAASGSPAMPSNTETKTVETESTSAKLDSTNKVHHLPPKSAAEPSPANKQGAFGDFEAVKRSDPTFPPRSPAVRRFKPQPIEVKSTSKETNKQDTTTSTLGNSRPQAIEVKSVAKNSQKPIVPPKPNCKFKPLDLGAMPSETQRLPPMSSKTHTEDRSQTIVVSSPTIYRKIPNDSTSNYTRKVAVSSVSSLKPPPNKPTAPSNVSVQPPPSEADTEADRQQRSGPPSQNSRYTQRHPTSATATGPTISSSALSDVTGHQPQAPAQTGAIQTSQTAVMDSNNQRPHPRMPYPHEPATMDPSDNAQPAPVSTAQGPGYIRQTYRRSFSNECSQKRNDLHFYASDDPPSYDDRESFSPLRLPDLPPRSSRYQPSSRPPPCSCTAGCPSHPHPHNSPHNLTPPAPTHSPGHYPVAQPALRPHHCRPDPQPVAYQPSSPKASPLGPGPPQGLYQPLHQPPACPPHPSLMHAYSAERPLPPAQHMDPRRPPVHRSPQQSAAVMPGAPYPDPAHSHSPGLSHMDPHYLCAPQTLGPSYGSDYGGDSSSLYSESNYGQTPRRVLMDPETGKYFYIEVPVQPLRKMLFDPETGQYVEVLIPQQAMSHSGLYPPSAPNYPPLHNTNMYAPAPQYMPYAAPPAQPQPPRYPEPSAVPPMHPHGPGVGYRNAPGQGPKSETQGHPPVDPNYLESMYYVPTGMNASPNPTPPDYYHKHPSNLPPTGGKRS
ncbi:mucin-17 [Periophthalmus magnuspinnatus]|uniref:mucin-17 n=1 Tax=Periophthalmus magnuspinnatus TaxID=409849 RepID=UPI0024362F99|nr:mucin-17 [Periophthalmus magnuspinnatus]